MVSRKTSKFLLWLFVIDVGIAFGAGLYEHRIVVPDWISSDDTGPHWNSDAARRDNTGLRFWAYVTTGPLTLLTLGNFIAAWKSSGAVRGWWLAGVLTILADRVLTFSYFIPTMIGLMDAADSPASVAIATRWAHLNNVRHALGLSGWLASLKAFSLYRAELPDDPQPARAAPETDAGRFGPADRLRARTGLRGTRRPSTGRPRGSEP